MQYKHCTNGDSFLEWRIDGDWWLYALFERDAYDL